MTSNRPPSLATNLTLVRVLIIEDLRDLREGLMTLINGTPGFRCLSAHRTMEDALARLGIQPPSKSPLELPDVVLTDLGLPLMSGIEGIRLLRAHYPELPILALTICGDEDQVFNALCAGASGYLLKDTPPARLLESLREVASGGAPMSPEVARRVVKLFREFRPPEQAAYHLTPQEQELLRLLVEGHHKKTAADAMGVSFHTVSFHLRNIYLKLEVHSKSEAVAKALRSGLV